MTRGNGDRIIPTVPEVLEFGHSIGVVFLTYINLFSGNGMIKPDDPAPDEWGVRV